MPDGPLRNAIVEGTIADLVIHDLEEVLQLEQTRDGVKRAMRQFVHATEPIRDLLLIGDHEPVDCGRPCIWR